MKTYQKIILAQLFFLLFFAGSVGAQSEATSFFVEKNFDVLGRSKIDVVLVKSSSNLYFYVEKTWWQSQASKKTDEILKNLDKLAIEFENRIYPNLTNVFGFERTPGIDNEKKITILFHSVKGNEAGYFRTYDSYEKIQVPTSNEKEMVYISADLLDSPNVKVILAHEFVHLITFNQKNINFNVEDDTWLNEARADYSSAILGYDDEYEGSNLQQRIKDFVSLPSDSITDWGGTKNDYASVSMFIRYLTDQYGIKILSDSLKSRYIGIESINYALRTVGVADDFSQIFKNWTIAVMLNDCSLGNRYCYKDPNLKNFKLSPSLNFLPISGSVSLSVNNVIKNWQGNWLKFIGGNGDLKIDFSGPKGLLLQVPYIVEDSQGSKSVKTLILDKNGIGEIKLDKFNTDYRSLIVMPFLQSDTPMSDNSEISHTFSYTVFVSQGNNDELVIKQLLEKIAYLKAQIASLLATKPSDNQPASCAIVYNLSYGVSGDSVKCLQEFLKGQGAIIYPEGLVTGYFGSFTKSAVIKFQEKYKSEILAPYGLSNGTGYVGPSTRQKINQLLGS